METLKSPKERKESLLEQLGLKTIYLSENYKELSGLIKKEEIPTNSFARDYLEERRTFLNSPVGRGQTVLYNYESSIYQLLSVLSFYMEAKQIENLKEAEDIATWEQEKVLTGIKVLDLGCGPEPAFAEQVQRLGAEVYTADLLDSSSIPESLQKNYLQCDISKGTEVFVEALKEKDSNLSFDFVTDQIVDAESSDEDQFREILLEIASNILEKDGICHGSFLKIYKKT